VQYTYGTERKGHLAWRTTVPRTGTRDLPEHGRGGSKEKILRCKQSSSSFKPSSWSKHLHNSPQIQPTRRVLIITFTITTTPLHLIIQEKEIMMENCSHLLGTILFLAVFLFVALFVFVWIASANRAITASPSRPSSSRLLLLPNGPSQPRATHPHPFHKYG
jgi:hypothetical protein